MTAHSTTVRHGQSSQDFRRGLFFGATAATLLATSMVAAAVGAGLFGASPQAAAPAAPAVEAYPDAGLRHAPAIQAPAVEAYPDAGLRHAPAIQAPAAPNVHPQHVPIPPLNIQPAPRIDAQNPLEKGPVKAY
jgi:hypothetical protein